MTAEYFDGWYADIARSTSRQQLFTDGLGLPAEVGPSNLVPLVGLQRIAAELRLRADDTLVDLACGRGGPGMWIAREVGAALIGVDISGEAISQATSRRSLFGLADSAQFRVGSLEDSGLADGIADAVVCIDAFQFGDAVAASTEIRRILRPGGRVVLTCWEPVDRTDAEVAERLRTVDLAGSLRAAGLVDVVREEQPGWHEVAGNLWRTALTVDPDGDPALQSTRAEAERSLANDHRVHRVMATATAP